MMCCNKCPFHPVLGSSNISCERPLCSYTSQSCSSSFCVMKLGGRCYQDFYVINHLFHKDPLAEKLAEHTFRTAVTGRDRALLLSLFQAADEELRMKFWNWLELFEPRSIWLLNPIFSSAGLAPLETFVGTGSRKSEYLSAIIANPYSDMTYNSGSMPSVHQPVFC